MLNIERALATYYPAFVRRHRRSARTLSRFLGFLFYEARFQKFANDYPHLRGFDFVEEVLRYFDFDLRLTERERARMFRKHVYRLGSDRPIFRSVETVAPAENPQLLRAELAEADCLGETRDGKVIYLCTMDAAPCVMREIGRLREFTFRAVGEGTGQPRDIDRYDKYYRQLVLWDRDAMEIAGAYRLADAGAIIEQHGLDGLYSASLFHYGPGMLPLLRQGLELGRSFVQPRYQTRGSLDYLWHGIGAYLKHRPQLRYLFGPASISRFYGTDATARLVHYYGTHYSGAHLDVSPRTPFELPQALSEQLAAEFDGCDLEEDFKALKQALAGRGLPVPTLYKHYSQATSPGGVCFTAFNVDKDFGDCVDSFVLADLHKLTDRKRQRYLES